MNSLGMELGPELHGGVLYFSSTRPGGPAPLSIHAAALDTGGRPGAPEPLPAPFNTGTQQGDFTLSPDGRFALFWSQREGSAAGDIYAVRRVGDGWDSQAIRLPSPINSAGFDFTPAFSANSTLLRIASDRAPSGLPELEPEARAYTVAHARLTRRLLLGTSSLELFVNAENLTDVLYSSFVQINAPGGRYFNPAPGRSFVAGVRFNFAGTGRTD